MTIKVNITTTEQLAQLLSLAKRHGVHRRFFTQTFTDDALRSLKILPEKYFYRRWCERTESWGPYKITESTCAEEILMYSSIRRAYSAVNRHLRRLALDNGASVLPVLSAPHIGSGERVHLHGCLFFSKDVSTQRSERLAKLGNHAFEVWKDGMDGESYVLRKHSARYKSQVHVRKHVSDADFNDFILHCSDILK